MERVAAGIIAGTHEVIRELLELEFERELLGPDPLRNLPTRTVPTGAIAELIDRLHDRMVANITVRTRSRENWRTDPQTYVHPENDSPEVVLERAIAMLADGGHLDGWWNQMPVASALANGTSDRRAAIDLARMNDDRLELYELKWESNSPVYAAFEILLYGICYVICRARGMEFGYEELAPMQAAHVRLNVLAPAHFYDGHSLAWLEAAIGSGYCDLAKRKIGIEGSFRFLTLGLGQERLFTFGKDAEAACGGAMLGPAGEILRDAMQGLRPLYDEA
ncbi:MAG: hypothetical protein C0484_02555 [Rhodospirillum sp.]|nr:hypothetical protein [Rhodospirillum sp.]